MTVIATTPRISAVIPAYNAASFVCRAIDSALVQTIPPCEVIVVDDGSSDATARVVGNYGSRVRLLRQKNGGPGAARNFGVRECQGDWVALLDADDEWLPHKLERQAGFIGDSKVGVVHSSIKGSDQVPDRATFDRLWTRNCIANSSALIRRTAWESVGGCDEDRSIISVEDYNLWLRIAEAGWDIVCCREELVAYISEPGHLMSQYERFARAELANVERIGSHLKLSTAQIEDKLVRTCDEQGRLLLYFRCMDSARDILYQAYRLDGSFARLGWLALSYMPRPLLEVRRAIREKSLVPFKTAAIGREKYGERSTS